MNKEKILVVDDEKEVVELLKDWLEEADYTVFTALDGKSALREFFVHKPELVVVDILMPGMDGFELCERIRELSEVPIIILSAKGQEMDKVRALNLGADEYLVKPIGRSEFLARVAALLRRAKTPLAEGMVTLYSDDVLTLDFAKHEAYVRGKKVFLTPLEYRLLSYLAQNSDRVLSHQELWDKVWGWEYGSPESVKWYVASLRKKIEEEPERPKLIITIRGVGYRYVRPGTEEALRKPNQT